MRSCRRIVLVVGLGIAAGCGKGPPASVAEVAPPPSMASAPAADPAKPVTADDVARVGKAVAKFGAGADEPPPGDFRDAVHVFYPQTPPLADADVPAFAAALAGTNVPFVLRVEPLKPFTKAGYAALFAVPNLREYEARNPAARDALVAHPGGDVPRLTVEFDGPADLGFVTKFPKVRSLGVTGPKLSGILGPLAGLTEVTHASLSGADLTDADIAVVRKWPKLKHLFLSGPNLTPAAWKGLDGVQVATSGVKTK